MSSMTPRPAAARGAAGPSALSLLAVVFRLRASNGDLVLEFQKILLADPPHVHELLDLL